MDEISFSFQNFVHLRNLSLNDLEAIRLILRGGSVIDWRRLNFESRNEIDALLAVNGYLIGDPQDQERIKYLHRAATGFIEENYDYEIPPSLKKLESVYDLFEYSSNWRTFNREQSLSCMLLKVMGIINHLDGHQLAYTLPIRSNALAHIVTEKIISKINNLKTHQCPIVEISGGEKSKNSQVIKVLAKTETLSSTIFDRLRFRLVVEHKANIIPVLYYFTREIFPFNYTIPGESTNDLIDYVKFLQNDEYAQKFIKDLQVDIGNEDELRIQKWQEIMRKNPFSAENFKIINFCFDLPIRVLDHFPKMQKELNVETGYIVFAMIEIQLMDQKSAIENESGEASHEKYKQRQLDKVWYRLVRGGRDL